MYITSIYNNNISINIKDLYSKITDKYTLNDYLTELLNKEFSNKCNSDGLLIKDSIRIIKRNIGTFNLDYNILYNIIYKADILFPNEGCIIENCKIIYSTDILYLAFFKKYNLIIIIPKNFIKDDNINIKKNNYINIICLDKYFDINDEYMFIIGIPYNNNNNNNNIYNISIEDNNDDNCKNIFNEITEFKSEYYDLFKNIKKQEELKQDITYNEYEYKEKNLPSILLTLKENIINYIETNNLQNININTILNINEENTLLLIFDYLLLDKHNQSIYIKYKQEFYKNFNEETYINIKNNNSNKLNINKTNNTNTIINNGNYCYIISVLQMLKNCKLFIKDFNNFSPIDEEKINIINELKLLLIENKNTLTDFIDLLDYYFNENNINWKIHNMNDANDFIYILFNIIDDNITTTRYIKNIYDNINPNHSKDIIKTNNNLNLNNIISNLKQLNNNSILKYFYNPLISEFKCTTCNFRYFHVENILTHNLNIDNLESNTINDCINLSYNNEEYIEGFQCEICKNKSIFRKLYFEIDSINYFICSLNKWIFTNDIIIKNDKQLNINNRLSLNVIDHNLSQNSLIFKNIILDLKSIICHIGPINSGHYFTINKDKNDLFYIYDDESKSKISNNDFFNNPYFQTHSYTLVYQNNIIHDLPFSNLSLLEYEDNILNDYNDNITKYIQHNILQTGISLGKKFFGGYNLGSSNDLIDNLKNIKYLINNFDPDIIYINDIISSFKNLINNNSILLDNFNKIDFTSNIENNLGEFILTYSNELEEYDQYFYIEIINLIIKKIKNDFDKFKEEEQINKFLQSDTILDNKNIYIGSSGYNTSDTNHWDVIYSQNDNNLDLYKNHFNSIEINHTYYNDYQTKHWQDILDQIKNASIKPIDLRFSIIFNKDLSLLLLNDNYIQTINTDTSSIISTENTNKNLENNIKSTFNNFWENKIQLLSDYIDNILLKFDSNFQYNLINFYNLKSFIILKDYLLDFNINLIFEFYDETWYQVPEVIDFFKLNDLSMTTLILNNDNKLFGDKLDNNYNNKDIKYLNNYYKVNYIKLYGSINKYFGSHINDIPMIFKYIKNSNNSKLLDKLNSKQKKQYIYFNNIEGDFNDLKYSENRDNIKIPAAIFEAKILYKLLLKFNKF